MARRPFYEPTPALCATTTKSYVYRPGVFSLSARQCRVRGEPGVSRTTALRLGLCLASRRDGCLRSPSREDEFLCMQAEDRMLDLAAPRFSATLMHNLCDLGQGNDPAGELAEWRGIITTIG